MRTRSKRRLGFNFNEIYYKPRAIPLSQLEEVSISDEDLETLRLRFIEKLDQDEAAKEMGVSQSQYQRDITLTLEKITSALINGKAIKIIKISKK